MRRFFLNIKKKLIANHEYNEIKNQKLALDYLSHGYNIGIVTDRGTPIISDPGYEIAKFIIDQGYNVVGLPGATALIPALIVSGLTPSPFMFYGFLNSKASKREKELANLKKEKATLIFYEAPHRIKDTMQSIFNVFGNRDACLCREISKLYEEVIRGKVNDIINNLDNIKGELVIVVEGNTDVDNFENMSILEHMNLYLEDGMTEKEAMKKVAHDRKIPKSEVYKEFHIGK